MLVVEAVVEVIFAGESSTTVTGPSFEISTCNTIMYIRQDHHTWYTYFKVSYKAIAIATSFVACTTMPMTITTIKYHIKTCTSD